MYSVLLTMFNRRSAAVSMNNGERIEWNKKRIEDKQFEYFFWGRDKAWRDYAVTLDIYFRISKSNAQLQSLQQHQNSSKTFKLGICLINSCMRNIKSIRTVNIYQVKLEWWDLCSHVLASYFSFQPVHLLNTVKPFDSQYFPPKKKNQRGIQSPWEEKK